MKMHTPITCVCCPFGCCLDVEHEDKQVITVSGNRCPRGAKYAAQELVDPRRSLTTTVAITGASMARLPVKTTAPVPKARIVQIARDVQKIVVQAPISCGDILLDAVDGDASIQLVATRSLTAL
ncbi:MAG: DUF1667 domain-containing protein [Proteobacteria bacterium]|nr:DUF1667 domain-containing protein [Pseudomonadota bacterium]